MTNARNQNFFLWDRRQKKTISFSLCKISLSVSFVEEILEQKNRKKLIVSYSFMCKRADWVGRFFYSIFSQLD